MKYWKLCDDYGEIIKVVCQNYCPMGYVESNEEEYVWFKDNGDSVAILYPCIIN